MKLELFTDKTVKLWNKMASGITADRLEVELDVYKRLLNFFQVGDYFYYIFNLNYSEFDLVSPQVEQVLGYRPDEFDVACFMDCLHPEDRPWFLSFETRTAAFLSQLPVEKLTKYKVRYDFRLRTKSGNYIRLLHQVAVVEHDDKGGITRTLGIETDITALKKDGKPLLSYIGLDGEPSYLDINVKDVFVKSREILTRREKQVLTLLIEGKLSKEISIILKISQQTVDMHRKNMLSKTETKNVAQLVAFGIRSGII